MTKAVKFGPSACGLAAAPCCARNFFRLAVVGHLRGGLYYTRLCTRPTPSVGSCMPAQLLALNEGPSILLDKPILLLGRDLECDIRLDSRKISRRHCCIAQVGEQLVVRDLGSTN